MKNKISITFLICLGLGACQQNTDTPTQVSEKYWQAINSGDLATAKSLVTKNTQANIIDYFALPDDKKITLDEIKLGKEQTSVHTTITSKSANANNADQFDFDTILVLQNGEWKIDAALTQIPTAEEIDSAQSADQLSDALDKNLDSMNEALEQGTDILNNFLQQGSKEMSDSLLKGMNEMNESLRDAIDKMKQRRNQEDSAQPPTDNNGEGLI